MMSPLVASDENAPIQSQNHPENGQTIGLTLCTKVDGHCMHALAESREGENILNNCMFALYAENGIEYAVDDISGALLDPAAVHEGRRAEMFFCFQRSFEFMSMYREKSSNGRVARSLVLNGSTSTRAILTTRTYVAV